MKATHNLCASNTLQQWIGEDDEDLLIAYSKELRDKAIDLLATLNDLGLTNAEQTESINKAANLMARLSVDMKHIHTEIFA